MLSQAELMVILKNATGETDESILTAYLSISKDIVLKQAYPYKDISAIEIPDKYLSNQVNIATYLLNKRGAEGEMSHNENGINRSYESSGIPVSLFDGIIPEVGIPS